MRVVAGEFRSRPLKSLEGNNTRPTTDKVKESLFNMIGPYFQGGKALDLFAGSGGLGIEALSRGVDEVCFVDKAPAALKIIKQNIQQLKLEERTTVIRSDAKQALMQLAQQQEHFDYVFLDPPYALLIIPELLQMMRDEALLNSGAMIVCEVDKKTEIDIMDGFECIKERTYGITKIVILKKV